MTRRYGLSEAEKDQVWELRAQGLSERKIGHRLGLAPNSVSRLRGEAGRHPPARRDAPSAALTLAEREEISRGIAGGDSARAIARRLRRSHTTIAREIERCGGRRRYRAHSAERQTWRPGAATAAHKLELHPELRRLVFERLRLDHSPQQIAGWLRIEYPDNEAMQVSHETIYRSLYIQARGALKRELTRHLRTRRQKRYARSQSSKGQRQGKVTEMVMISERPPEVEDRAVPGHWEGDLLMGNRQSAAAIATLVERSTRYCQLVALPEGTEAERVCEALAQSITTLPAQLRRSLTWDQGHEMSEHRRFSVKTGVDVYFCDPRSPWQRGLEREHQRIASPVLPQGPKPRGDHPRAPRRGRRAAQRPAAKDARVSDPRREARRADRGP